MTRKNGFHGIFLTLIVLATLSATSSYGKVLTIRGKHIMQPSEETSLTLPNAFKSDVSQKNLLGLTRKTRLSLPDMALSAYEAKTIKICAIRVQFQREYPDDDPLTTGDGNFDMRDVSTFISEEDHEIDMSPHNKTYFETHLRALNKYWNVVSNGRVELDYAVFPTAEDSVYTLSHRMGHYGSKDPRHGLAEFFVESFEIADADTAIDFAKYDAFIVFHAGADRQMDIGYPLTPSDLFTGFILLHPSSYVTVDDSVIISEGVMCPEAVSQDNRVIALNGVFAHEFGHQLGLVDLYDTRTFMTQVGDFSLMDNMGRGTAAEIYFGEAKSFHYVLDVLPVFPDAWSRAYLGFADVVEISNANNQEVWAAELETDMPQILKVPISDQEYFLIENRQFDSDRDDSTNLRVDNLTGIILGPAPADADDPRYLTRDYDFFLPGAGILIWHIDETRAYLDYVGDGVNNFYDNTLQWYNFYPCLIPDSEGRCIDSIQWENRRFVSVVEADGIIDFGGNYRTRFGSPFDFFFDGNNKAFTPYTNPSTRSNSGAYTGIRITDISKNDTMMTVSISTESRMKGFPKFVNHSEFPPTLVHLDRDGIEEIFISGKRHIVAMKADGSPLTCISPLPEGDEILDSTFVLYSDTARGGTGYVVSPDSDSFKGGCYIVDTLRSIAVVGLGEKITTPPLVADINFDGVFEIVAGTDSGKIHIWEVEDQDMDGRADSLMVIQESGGIIAGPVAHAVGDGPYDIVFGTEDGVYARYDISGELVQHSEVGRIFHLAAGSDVDRVYFVAKSTDAEGRSLLMNDLLDTLYDFGAVDVVGFTAADLDDANGTDFAAVTTNGKLTILLSGSQQGDDYSVNEVGVSDSLAGGVITAALDPTVPYYQIIFAGDNKIHVYNCNGTPFSNFPQVVDIHRSAGLIRSTPLVVDVDRDERPDIIVGTGAGELFAFRSDGRLADDYPRFAGSGNCLSAAAIEGFSANNYAGTIFALCGDNRLYGIPVQSKPLADEQSWRQVGKSSMQQNFRSSSTLTPVEPSGGDLIVSFYNYPNPANDFTNIRYRLRKQGTVKIQIYDLSGRLVYEDEASGENVDEEYRWNLDGYPSGVYICRLEALSGGSSEVKTHKIAVIK